MLIGCRDRHCPAVQGVHHIFLVSYESSCDYRYSADLVDPADHLRKHYTRKKLYDIRFDPRTPGLSLNVLQRHGIKYEISKDRIEFQFLGMRDQIALGCDDPICLCIVFYKIQAHVLGIIKSGYQVHMDHGHLVSLFYLPCDLGDGTYISVKHKDYLNIFL